MRLSEWRLSSNEEVFAYAGDEVELSVWNSETAFSTNPGEIPTSDASAKKRKRGDQLLPGEIWRAKNVGFYVHFIWMILFILHFCSASE